MTEDHALILWDKTCDIPVEGADLQRVPAVTLEKLMKGEEMGLAVLLAFDDATLNQMHDGCEYEVRAWKIT